MSKNFEENSAANDDADRAIIVIFKNHQILGAWNKGWFHAATTAHGVNLRAEGDDEYKVVDSLVHALKHLESRQGVT